MTNIQFNEERHEYTYDGLLVPSVTTIISSLSDYSSIPLDVLNRKARIGTAVHKACELDDENNLNTDSLHQIVAGYLEGWRLFKMENNVQILANEQKVFHKKKWFAGTLDRILSIDRGEVLDDKWLIDIKTSVKIMPAYGVQTAGYLDAYNYGRSDKVMRRGIVQLLPDGKYNFHECTGKQDLAVFDACHTIFNWRVKNEQ